MLGDQGQCPVVLVGVGLGVGERRAHADQQQPAIWAHAGGVTADIDPIVVGVESVGQLHDRRRCEGD